MKRAKECDWTLGVANSAQNICGFQALKSHRFKCFLLDIHLFLWEPPQIQLSLRGIAPNLQPTGYSVYFSANSQAAWENWAPDGEKKRCQEQTRIYLWWARTSPGDLSVQSQLKEGEVGRWPSLMSWQFPQSSKVSSATNASIPS